MEIEEIDNEKYFTLFEQFKQEKKNEELSEINSRILIVDFLNLFLRSFTGSPAMNDDGQHMGGITASLQSLGHAIRLVRATRCIVVADGEGGSSRRRKIYPDYKMKRRAQKLTLNRPYDFNTQEEELEAMKKQAVRLIQYLSHLPVSFVSIDNVEADDIIAYLANEVYNKSENKITIMSSDKDFLQLVNDRIELWSPTKKKMYTNQMVIDEYKVPPNNFLYYRMLDGDDSDNIPGVEGVGLKTIHKFLPFITSSKKTNIDEIIKYAEQKIENKDKKKFYTNIVASREKLTLNEQLMQLESPQISANAKMKVTQKVTGEIPTLNKYEVHLMYVHDKLSNAIPNIDQWLLSTFSILNAFAMNYKPNGESK